MKVYPSRMYSDPALTVKLTVEKCENCKFEKGKWDSWEKVFYFVCTKGNKYGTRCKAYK